MENTTGSTINCIRYNGNNIFFRQKRILVSTITTYITKTAFLAIVGSDMYVYVSASLQGGAYR